MIHNFCTILIGFCGRFWAYNRFLASRCMQGHKPDFFFLLLAFYISRLWVFVDFYEHSKLKRLQLDCEINRAIKKPTVILQQLLIIYKQTSARTVL